MDLLFQPQTVGKGKRFITPLAFRSYSMPLAGEFQYSGLCYIGANTSYITRLMRIYNKAYAADRLEHAKGELIRRVEKESNESNEIPEIIVCEASFGLEAIRKFVLFLRHHPVLNSIPFVLEGSHLSEKELSLCRKNVRVDEILFLEECDDRELKPKFQFLCKVKAKAAMAARLVEEKHVVRRRVAGHPSKRAFDIAIASLGLLVLSPLFVLIAVAVKLESGGPVFYISKRAGRGYRIFNFFKFRTMYKDADQKMAALKHLNQYTTATTGPIFFKINNDPRITRVGKFLRNTSLDELPQLLNVFLGDMSLVGNRPLPLYEASTLTTDDYAARFMAPAGITGLWQIKKRGNKDMSVEERINIDIDYAAKCSFVTDFWIIANTPSALFQKENV
jgi:lipopolysaccharide/colanic/teichoic acid biosynthesis glycosyltransferase